MARVPIPTWMFALTVVRLGHRFLLVHERKHGQRWYLPAGRVEPGESILAAAERETLEEAGVPIVLEGVLRMEHTPDPQGGARLRVFFLARPKDDTSPKRIPDSESLEAAWVSLEDLADRGKYPLRGDEVRQIMEAVLSGAPVFPLHLLTYEGAPWKRG